MRIAPVMSYNTRLQQSNTDKTFLAKTMPAKKNAEKLLYASVFSLGILAIGRFVSNLIKSGKSDKNEPIQPEKQNIDKEENKFEKKETITESEKELNTKTYDEKGNLYNGVLTKASPNGHVVKVSYVDGLINNMTIIPPKGENYTKLEKTYDRTIPGIIAINGTKTKEDGSVENSFSADFTEKKFSPEVEQKIKMSEFDKLLKGDEINGQKLDKKYGVVDLGDGLSLEYDTCSFEQRFVLKQNGKTLREKIGRPYYNIFNNQVTASIARYVGGKFMWLKQGNTYYMNDGSKTIKDYSRMDIKC